MSTLFNGEWGRKQMLRQYFNKKSTKDFTEDEARVVMELLLNHKEPIMKFYDENIRSGKNIETIKRRKN